MGDHERVTVATEESAASATTVLAPATPSIASPARMLELQRTAGNRAVGAWLSRMARSEPARRIVLQRLFTDARADGWNAKDVSVAGTLRIPLEGIGLGNQVSDNPVKKKLPDGTFQTVCTESAKDRAVVIVPDAAVLSSGTVEVMLHFHGQNLGGRERAAEKTVRDVEVDRIPQQLVHSGRNIVAVLPQGPSGLAGAARFNIADPRAYVNTVLTKAASHLPSARLPSAGTLQAGRIVVTGHSGGGGATTAAAAALQPVAGAVPSDADWLAGSPLVLFDAVNSPGELTAVTKLVTQMLDTDLAKISAAGTNAGSLLTQRGLKFRSTYGTGSWDGYHATNVGGDAHDTKTKAVSFTIPAKDSVKGVIDAWFKKNDAALGANSTPLREQYRVQQVTGVHDDNVGTGSGPTTRGAVPGGVTAPAGSVGVPDYSGGGHLEDTFALLNTNAIPAVSQSGTAPGSGAPPIVVTPAPTGSENDLDAGAPNSEFDEDGFRLPAGVRALARTPTAATARTLARVEDVPARLTAATIARGRTGPTPQDGKSLLSADYIRDTLAVRDTLPWIKRSFASHCQTLSSIDEGPQRDARYDNEAGSLVIALENEFIWNPDKSAVDLLPPDRAAHYRALTWGTNDYPGNGGPLGGEAAAMAKEMTAITPERRPNAGATAVITEAERDAHLSRLVANLKPVPEQPGHQLFSEAAEQFAYMAAIAALDGVELKILSSWRDPAVAKANAAKAGNSAAVASFSSHSLGLAVDIQMAGGSQHFAEIQTHPMSNVYAMRASPVHKWLVFHAAWFGWFPYGNEPWHWEYNPSGFRDRYRDPVIPHKAPAAAASAS